MASTSKRVIWKGAISFGLVHIPIALHSATSDQRLDFDWLDKRSMDPIGYKRINKRTGKEVQRENIVKGIAYADGQYVVLSSEEIASAYPKITQTIEIEAFVAAADIPFVYLERPYYITPINKAEKVYALLREALHKSGKVGIAKVVIQTKQHLALLAPVGPALVLELLRWGDEVRSGDALELPPAGSKATGLTARELQMAEQLIAEMSQPWKAENFTDTFKEQILKLVDEKIKAGDTAEVTPVEIEATDTSSAKIYDLTEMLQRSLAKGGAKPAKTTRAKTSAKATTKKTASGKPKSVAKRTSA
jgi:DNA end-binding protein Ku